MQFVAVVLVKEDHTDHTYASVDVWPAVSGLELTLSGCVLNKYPHLSQENCI